METLQTISSIAIIAFAVFYLVGFSLNRRDKFTKKYILKKTLKKYQVDIWSMEFNHNLLEQNRIDIIAEKEEKEKQLKSLGEIKVRQEKELELLKKAEKWDEKAIKEKLAEIEETITEMGGQKETGQEKDGKREIEVKGIKGEIAQAIQAVAWCERQMGELTKQISNKQMSLDAGEMIIKGMK